MANGESSFHMECRAADWHAAKDERDITRGNVPLMIVVALMLAVSAAAYRVGGIFSVYEKERSETFIRLDSIEDKLDAVLSANPQIKIPPKKRRPRATPEAS